jgi:hypothetical protein
MQLKVGFFLVVMAGAAAPLAAQRQQQPTKDSAKAVSSIPDSARPPKGMCRIWIDGVPAAQQRHGASQSI